jgi:hypothetical protein
MLPEQRLAVTALLRRSARNSVPIRRAFVQAREPGGGPGMLSEFVGSRRRRALDLYLLLHAAASRPPWDVDMPGAAWGRMLGLFGPSTGTVVARQWSWLEERRLVARTKVGRQTRITLLHEDGSGRPYWHPGTHHAGRAPEGDYFHLPYAYWQADMQDWADLPMKAVLLIALSLPREFLLPLDHGRRWYGLSRDTLRTGLRGLSTRGFLDMRLVKKAAPLTTSGYTFERRYRLRSPFETSISSARRPAG